MKQQRERYAGQKAPDDQRPKTEQGRGQNRATQNAENERNQDACGVISQSYFSPWRNGWRSAPTARTGAAHMIGFPRARFFASLVEPVTDDGDTEKDYKGFQWLSFLLTFAW
jgi:ribosome modulation factor